MTSPQQGTRLAATASCLTAGCDWRLPLTLDVDQVDLEARRHTGERKLSGGPGHPTVVRAVPVC